MKTKEEIKEQIIELHGATLALGEAMNFLHAQRMEKKLYGATLALSEAMNFLHAQRMEKSKQIMSLNHMLKEMEDDSE